jgi:hypothetical protein
MREQLKIAMQITNLKLPQMCEFFTWLKEIKTISCRNSFESSKFHHFIVTSKKKDDDVDDDDDM